jgi:hypothetical protein
MFPPIFPAINASSACRALLKTGQSELRFYQFGLAPQPVVKPYAVWTRVYGEPGNYLGQVPDADSFTIQIDIYSDSAETSRNVALAIRDAIEPLSYITNWLGESRDPETKNYRFSLQNDWIVERA